MPFKNQNFVIVHYNHSVVIWPITTPVLLNLIANLIIQQHAASTVQFCISATAFLHKLKGLHDPTNSKALQGLMRTRSKHTALALPIIFLLLNSMASLPTICSPYEVRCFTYACSFSILCLAQSSRLQSTKYTTASHNIPFQAIEVRFKTYQVRIIIPHSKSH